MNSAGKLVQYVLLGMFGFGLIKSNVLIESFEFQFTAIGLILLIIAFLCPVLFFKLTFYEAKKSMIEDLNKILTNIN